jgi:serralysin
MHINLIYQGAAAAPEQQDFRNGMQVAARILENAFDDNITINIAVGYGEINGSPLPSQNTSQGNIVPVNIDYSSLRGLLASHASSLDDKDSVKALPDDTALQGQTTFQISTGQAKALGILPANDDLIDGYVGMGTSFTAGKLVGVALHELTHAMGRVVGTSLDLFRYTIDPASRQPVHLFGSWGSPIPAAYFSVDKGITDLADFGRTSDQSDFDPSSPRNPSFDPYNESGNIGASLTSVDLTVMDVLGYHRADDYAENPSTTGNVPFKRVSLWKHRALRRSRLVSRRSHRFPELQDRSERRGFGSRIAY